ncbi:hypothetical protein BX600DRAFT_508894 [Xylariales sp. PMI_506]|nr:hypothetical protein BX600DRAFT_508894 [Xylariales sp. PMI_506]
MYSQPGTPASASLGLSRGSLLKALTLLVFVWLVAAYIRVPSYREGSNYVDYSSSGSTTTSDDAGETQKGGSLSPWNPVKQRPSIKQHTDRVAVIIENRPIENLVPVILHFHSVLGPEWPIIFYTSPTTSDTLMSLPAFARVVDEKSVIVRHLPPEVVFNSHYAVSLFLADTWIWQDLAPYEKVLIFQSDSIICSASKTTVDDFLQYDLIGAPIAPAYGEGYNGGLSLRNREITLDLFTRYSWANDSSTPGAPPNMKYEDQWLYMRMSELPPGPDGKPGANLPSLETAMTFAVETIWADDPLGFHQPVRWQMDNMDKILKYCPEVGMISGSTFF